MGAGVSVRRRHVVGYPVAVLLSMGLGAAIGDPALPPAPQPQPQALPTQAPEFPPVVTPSPQPTKAPAAAAPRATPRPRSTSVYYVNCAAVRAAGADPIRKGQPGYRAGLDRDGDGVGCE
jgi:hypothetical protein